jgi:ubiquinone/menaquinone biosynthesis C-methylase UbiE
MINPWFDIPLAEYEGHMALPQVAQAQLLADVFEGMLKEYRPQSLAVLGCAGGNGFERISIATTTRVVGVDINPTYVETLRARFQERIPNLELIVGDIQREAVRFPPVAFVFAALVLEYVDVKIVLERVRSLLTAGGILGAVVQLPSSASSPVTPSPFSSIQALAPFMRLVRPEQLKDLAETTGYQEIASSRAESLGGKQFQVQAFRLLTPNRSFKRSAKQPRPLNF